MIINFDTSKKANDELKRYKGSAALDLYVDAQRMALSVSDYFEKLDPSELDDSGKPVGGIDAMTRHLIINDIKLSGQNQLSVAQLYDKVQYLVPELILREIRAGMEVAEKYAFGDCVAVTVPHKTATYHPIYIPELDLSSTHARNVKSLARTVRAGSEMPRLQIMPREQDISIRCVGRVIETAYATIRDYGFSDFAILLRLIGAQLAADKMYDIYDLAIHGSGSNPAATNTFNGTAGTLSYSDLIHNQTSFDAPYVMDRILAPVTSLETILAMPQFQDPMAGWEFQKSGKLVTPMGAKLKQVSTTPAGAPTGTVIVTIDSRFAVREVVTQPLSVEADKIISRRVEECAVSEESRFCIIAGGAMKQIVWT